MSLPILYHTMVWDFFVLGGRGVVVEGGVGCTSRGGCEMPQPCVKNIEQAQGKLQVSKSSLTM